MSDVEDKPKEFQAKENDLDLIRYCLDQTEGILELLLEEGNKE